MKYILLFCIYMCGAGVTADTILQDSSISTNTILTKSKSPYVVNQNITVQPGVTLTIEKGVRLVVNQGGIFVNRGSIVGVDFSIESKASNYNFLVQCSMCSIDLNGVTVTGVPRSFISAWGDSHVKLQGVDIDFSSKGLNTIGVQAFNKTLLTISNSSFTRLTKALDIFSFSTTTISNSSFTYNDHAIYTFDSSIDVIESDFEYNHVAIEFFANLDVLPIVDAHNNWWGQASFPPIYRDDISQVEQSDINAIVGVVIYDPWSREPHRKKEPVQGISNVLFLPGFMGSRLYVKETFENQLWEPNRNKDVKELFLDSLGKSIRANIYTRDIISKTNLAGGVSQIDQSLYKDFESYMNELVKSKTMNSWKALPYDWRFSVDTILEEGIKISDGKNTFTSNLTAEVVALAKNSKSKKVTLVTHSNGGLVGKQLLIELQKQKLDSLIDKVIFVAMPEYGTPQAITSLLYGHEQSIANGLILKSSLARDFGLDMPSAYVLLPSSSYFQGGKTIKLENAEVQNVQELSQYLTSTNRVNATLLSKAKTIHEILDTWIAPKTIPIYQIVGTGILTVSGVSKNSEGKPLPIYSPTGDGTVQDMYHLKTELFNRTGKVFIVDLHSTKFKHMNMMNSSDTMKYLDLLIRKNPKEAAEIPFGKYPIYPDVFNLFTFSPSSSTVQLSDKNIHITHEEGKDVLQHTLLGQFDFANTEDSEGRFDVFNKSIQYVSQTSVQELKIPNSKNDTFDLGVYIKNMEHIKEIQYEDITLFKDSTLTLNLEQSNVPAVIDLPLMNEHIQILPTVSNSTTTHTLNFTDKIASIKNNIQQSNITQYVKDRYIRRLTTVQKNKDESAFTSLAKSLEIAITAIDSISYNPTLKYRYAKLRQDYIYIVYLLK